jgi:hypothetical protein
VIVLEQENAPVSEKGAGNEDTLWWDFQGNRANRLPISLKKIARYRISTRLLFLPSQA